MSVVFEKIASFFRDVASESKKISWPSRSELVDSTFVVLFFIVFLAGVVLVFDKAIRFALDIIYV